MSDIHIYRCEDHGFAMEAGEDFDIEAGGAIYWCLDTYTKFGLKGPYQVPCNKPVEKIAVVESVISDEQVAKVVQAWMGKDSFFEGLTPPQQEHWRVKARRALEVVGLGGEDG